MNLADADGPTPAFTAPAPNGACSTIVKFTIRVHDGYEWSGWSPSAVVNLWMACDANHDGVCDQGDVDCIIERWPTDCPQEPCLCDLEADLDGNGNVGLSDIVRVTPDWGRSCTERARSTVPPTDSTSSHETAPRTTASQGSAKPWLTLQP